MPPWLRHWALAWAWALLLCLTSAPAAAQVTVSFHSFDGSLFGGRYPHTFVVFQGTLDGTGERIDENYGFSAKKPGPSALMGSVASMVISEQPVYVTSTNRHFAVAVNDDVFRRMKAEIARWRDAPGKFYNLDHRNCIHFVGRIAEMAGLAVDYPKSLIRKPKAWLNHITRLNPQLGAKPIA